MAHPEKNMPTQTDSESGREHPHSSLPVAILQHLWPDSQSDANECDKPIVFDKSQEHGTYTGESCGGGRPGIAKFDSVNYGAQPYNPEGKVRISRGCAPITYNKLRHRRQDQKRNNRRCCLL